MTGMLASTGRTAQERARRNLGAIWITCFVLVTTAAAQPTIIDVVNAASRIPAGYPSYGIAQGALFAIVGRGIGPAQFTQASFPLPTTDGLAGVTVQINVGGSTVNGIMVYASPNEVGVILPSNTSTGTGTVTVNNNGVTASAPITVVKNAFGLFASAYGGLGSEGMMPLVAAAFNVAGDGSTSPNLSVQPAQNGQPVLINGTGLGAITSDETQSGVTDVPNAPLHVYVGTQEAQVVSADRGTSCTGLSSTFPLPQGIAAWDVIQLIVPDGVVGCNVGVTVQTGNFISNTVTISVSPDGSPCTDPTAVDPGDTFTLSGTVTTGQIVLYRDTSWTSASVAGTTITSASTIDSGTASFIQYNVAQPITTPVYLFATGTLATNPDPGTCVLLGTRTVVPVPAAGTAPQPHDAPVPLDAGPSINLTSSHASKQLKKGKQNSYSGELGTVFSDTFSPPSGNPFLEPGTITADNGSGGTDLPPFSVSLTLPTPALSWDNIAQLNNITLSQGATVKWSGGDPNGFVTITGVSLVSNGFTPGSVSLSAGFVCGERISAGQFTVPPWITSAMPIPGPTTTPGNGAALNISSYVTKRVSIPSVDLALFGSVVIIQNNGVTLH